MNLTSYITDLLTDTKEDSAFLAEVDPAFIFQLFEDGDR